MLSVCIQPSFAQGIGQSKLLGAYFEEWSIYYAGYNIANLQQNGVAGRLSHLIYAFANVTATPAPACVMADPWADYQTPWLPSVSGQPYPGPLYGNFAAIQQLKALHPNLTVLMSIGGWSATNLAAFQTVAATQAGRQAFVSLCINMFVKGNIAPGITAPGLFDGFNIDWEFPTAADKANFTALLTEFRTQLNALSKTTRKKYTMSFDGPAGLSDIKNINVYNAAAQVDFVTVDGYNYAGSWDTVTNDASPIYDSPSDPLYGQGNDINDTLLAYLQGGISFPKYLMGIPLYGAGWTGVPNKNHGLYQNSTGPSPVPMANGVGLCTDLSGNTPGCDFLLTPGLATYATLANLAKNGYTVWYDTTRVDPTLYDPATKIFYSYDNLQSAADKAFFVINNGLGGAYVWAAKDDDANGSMVKAIATGLHR